MREITLGRSNEKMVEVKDGVEEGDEVILNPVVLLSEKERMEYGNLPARSGKGGSGGWGGKGKGGKGKEGGGMQGGGMEGNGMQGGPKQGGGMQGGGMQGGPKQGGGMQGGGPRQGQGKKKDGGTEGATMPAGGG
jgi:hypothetical protein